MSVLSIKNLKKQIGGREILKNLEFDINEKEIVGFLGPNGSGKSTTLKCICGLYRTTSGNILIDGYDIRKNRKEALKSLGVSIESPALYPKLTGREHIRMMGRWRQVNKERIKEMEEYSGLGKYLDKVTVGYSMGMKMRLMLAMTLLAKPKLIILDEPTNGLDPQAVFELRGQMEVIRKEGSSILFSSHQLGEVEKLADRIIILKQGEKIYDGFLPTQFMNGLEYHMHVSNAKEAIKILNKHEVNLCEFTSENENWISCIVQNKEEFNKVLSLLQVECISIFDIIKCDPDLEDFYKAIYEGRCINGISC